MTTKTVSVDMVGLEKLLKARLAKDEGKVAAAGIFKDKNMRSDGRSNAGMAMAHEYGSPEHNIPERSHFQSAFKENKKKYLQMLKKGQPLQDISTQMALDIVNKIATGKFVALEPHYKKLKQEREDLAPGNRTLIATAEYIDAIDGRLVDDSGRKGG